MAAKVAHTIAGLKDRAGGVSRSVPLLCEALSRQGCPTVLVSQRPVGARDGELLLPDRRLVDTRLLRGRDLETLRFSYTPRLRRKLISICREVTPAAIHDHGLWLQMNHDVAAVAASLGIPRVVSPRGMLETWSIAYRGWKKRLAWHAYQRDDLLTAAAFCATSTMEAESIRKAGLMQPIAVIPNGIELPAVVERNPVESARKTLLFMSRLHPKKGLLDLVAAWSKVSAPDWKLVIAGPDEDGHRSVVENAAAQAGISGSIDFVGAVSGPAKQALLRTADLFVLPSYSENFGIVVAEALSYGVPVITTTATPWEELSTSRCGWWIPTGAAALANALREAIGLDGHVRVEMGRRGRALIEARFSSEAAASSHIAFYTWLAGEGAPPDFLYR